MIEIYEYAGFQYIVESDELHQVTMVPLDGQHVAAWKEKHRMSARQQYLQEKASKHDE